MLRTTTRTRADIQTTRKPCLARIAVRNQKHPTHRQRVVRKRHNGHILTRCITGARNNTDLPILEPHTRTTHILEFYPVVGVVCGIVYFVENETIRHRLRWRQVKQVAGRAERCPRLSVTIIPDAPMIPARYPRRKMSRML